MAPTVSPNLVVNETFVSGRKTYRVRINDWPFSPANESRQTVLNQFPLEDFEEEMQTTANSEDGGPKTWPVEKIVNKRIRKGCKMFEVKWEGYPETTWEPEENIPKTLIKEFEEVARKTCSVEKIVGQKMVNDRVEENISETSERSGERENTVNFPKSWSAEDIVNERMKNGRKMFEVKWRGYRKTTWEPRENIPEALVREFEQARRETRESSKTWFVEKILKEEMKDGHKMYQVKWMGRSECTWRPKESIPEIVIKKYEEKKRISAKARKTWPVKSIVNEKMKKGRKLYQIKWVGWKNTSWEPKENIPEILIKEYEQKNRTKLPNGDISENKWRIKEILGQRVEDGRTMFEVKWDGWLHPTWEPEENIPETLLKNFKEKRLTAVEADEMKLEVPSESTEAGTANSGRGDKVAAKERNRKLAFENITCNSDESTSEENSSEDDEDDNAVEPRLIVFKKNLTPHKILGALNDGGKLMYLIQWKGLAKNAFVLANEANKRCPQLVIKFLQSKIEWNLA